LIYVVAEPPPSQNTSNLWACPWTRAPVSPAELRKNHQRRRLRKSTQCLPADGKKLVFSRFKPQLDVYVAELLLEATSRTPRRLTLDDADDLPFDWTFDDSSVISLRTAQTPATFTTFSASALMKLPRKC